MEFISLEWRILYYCGCTCDCGNELCVVENIITDEIDHYCMACDAFIGSVECEND